VHGPLQPVNIEPSSAATPVKVSTVPPGKLAEHVPVGTLVPLKVQLIAPDVSETTPFPVAPLAGLIASVNVAPVPPPEAVITVESDAGGGATDPPPETLAIFTCGEVALAATFTVAVITG